MPWPLSYLPFLLWFPAWDSFVLLVNKAFVYSYLFYLFFLSFLHNIFPFAFKPGNALLQISSLGQCNQSFPFLPYDLAGGILFPPQIKFLIRKYLFNIIKNSRAQHFYALTVNLWVSYCFLLFLVLTILYSCFTCITSHVTNHSWTTAHEVYTFCFYKISSSSPAGADW